MAIKESILPEFDQEMATTRQLLELTSEGKSSFKQHPKSWNLGQLGIHIARLPTWTVMTLQQTELDIDPPGSSSFPSAQFESTETLVKLFDESVKGARAAIASASDADFMVPWTLKKRGADVFTLPRARLSFDPS